MAEHISEQEWWLNMGNVSNKVSEVNAEDLGNVASNLAKWQAIWGQIRDDQRKNTNTSKFLTYLLINIKNEEIRSYMDMFVTYIVIPDSDKKQMIVMTDELVWLFLPRYSDIADQFDLIKQYPIEYHQKNTNVIDYTDYVAQLIHYYPTMRKLNPEWLVWLVILLMTYHQILDTQLEKNALIQLKLNLTQKFFISA